MERSKKNLSAQVILALAVIGLGVILAACANSSNSVVGALATPTVDRGPEETATALERTIDDAVAATVVELRIQTAVAATVRAARTATAAAKPTATPTATATPAPTETPTITPAATPVRNQLLGININPFKAGQAPTLEEINELGIGWVRFVAYAQHLQELGDILGWYTRMGVRVVLVVNQETVPWNGDERPWTYAERFAEAFGLLVKDHGGKVAAWEVWNEPEDPVRWKHLSKPDYLRLLELSFDRAKGSDPATVILAGGYAESVNLDRPRCDGYAYHVYGERVGGFPTHYHHDLNLEAVHRQTGVPVWVTEFGAAVESLQALGGDPEVWQAEYLARMVGQVRQKPFVRVMIYFGFVDLSNGEAAQKYGLLTLDFTERAAYQTFASLTGTH